jgi:hypothetical protein
MDEKRVRKLYLSPLICLLMLFFFCAEEGRSQRLAAICLGGNSLDLEDLNRSLSNKNLGQLDNNNLCLEGFGTGLLGEHLLVGFEAGGFWQKSRSDSVLTKLSGVDAYLDVGYLFQLSEQIETYPFVGVGLGWMLLKLVPDQAGLTFGEVLSSPRRISKLTSSGLVFNFGAGLHWLVYQRISEYTTENWYVGLRVGYKYMPNPSSWSMEDLEISGGPKVSFTGPYIYFYLGWGPEDEEKYQPVSPER